MVTWNISTALTLCLQGLNPKPKPKPQTLNPLQVGEVRNLSKHMEYSPFVVLGNGKFQVTINRCLIPNP